MNLSLHNLYFLLEHVLLTSRKLYAEPICLKCVLEIFTLSCLVIM